MEINGMESEPTGHRSLAPPQYSLFSFQQRHSIKKRKIENKKHGFVGCSQSCTHVERPYPRYVFSLTSVFHVVNDKVLETLVMSQRAIKPLPSPHPPSQPGVGSAL